MHDRLTESDIAKIEKEIEYRKLVVRREAIEAVKEARAHGDLSENFEYHAAKRDKNKNESRIRYLENMIRTARVIEERAAEDEVGMNNTVLVYSERTEKEKAYRIVTTIRTNPLKGLVSIESPMGKAIYRKKIGDRVYVDMGNGDGYYAVIRAIDKTTDDSEDEIRGY